jgi:hypothetical protein
MKQCILVIALVLCLFVAVFGVTYTYAMGFNGGHGHNGGGDPGGGVVGGVPEIDPGMAASAIGLLTCGVLVLTGKRRKH